MKDIFGYKCLDTASLPKHRLLCTVQHIRSDVLFWSGNIAFSRRLGTNNEKLDKSRRLSLTVQPSPYQPSPHSRHHLHTWTHLRPASFCRQPAHFSPHLLAVAASSNPSSERCSALSAPARPPLAANRCSSHYGLPPCLSRRPLRQHLEYLTRVFKCVPPDRRPTKTRRRGRILWGGRTRRRRSGGNPTTGKAVCRTRR